MQPRTDDAARLRRRVRNIVATAILIFGATSFATLDAVEPAQAQSVDAFGFRGGFGGHGGFGEGGGWGHGGWKRGGFGRGGFGGRRRIACPEGCGPGRYPPGHYPPRGPGRYPPRWPVHYPHRPIFYPQPIVEDPPPDYIPPDEPDEPPYRRPPRHRPIHSAPPDDPPPRRIVVHRVPRPAPPPPAPRPAPRRLVVNPQPSTHFVVPTPSETRYVPDEVLVEIPAAVTATILRGIERRFGLTLISSKDLALLGTHINRYRIARPRTVPDTVRGLRADARVAGAQPNYVFSMQQLVPPPLPGKKPPTSVEGPPPGSLQYVVAALHLEEAHHIATGKGVRIAIIDSGIDGDNPEIKGNIIAKLDAIGGNFQPHSHGTAIAGAIVAHDKLIGVAPDAGVIAIRAFTGDGKPSGAEGSSSQVIDGLEFAAAQNAAIVNMSFAGPHDDLLARELAALRARGVIEIAAAGNGGAKSDPLYPGADTGVLAVTATDSKGNVFNLANRGAYVAIAAPGVDVLLPAPGGAIQITSGTSIAAAHVSGIAALALEKFGKLTPDSLVRILDAAAHKPSTGTPLEYGAGVIDAFAVLQNGGGQAASGDDKPVASVAPR